MQGLTVHDPRIGGRNINDVRVNRLNIDLNLFLQIQLSSCFGLGSFRSETFLSSETRNLGVRHTSEQ